MLQNNIVIAMSHFSFMLIAFVAISYLCGFESVSN